MCENAPKAAQRLTWGFSGSDPLHKQIDQFAEAIVPYGGQGFPRFEPPRFSFIGLRPNIQLPLDDHREHPHFARYRDAVCVETLLVRENPNCFCSGGAPNISFFVGFARGRLRRLKSFDWPTLGNPPPPPKKKKKKINYSIKSRLPRRS